MPEKISKASLILKILFISVFFLMAAAAVVVHIFSYDDFTVFILRFTGSEDKLEQFRTAFLTTQKFTILRISILAITALYALLIFSVKPSKVILFLEEVRKDSFLLFQRLGSEISKMTFLEKTLSSFVFLVIAGFHLFYFIRFPMFIDEAFSYVHFVSKGLLTSASYYPGPNNHVFYSELCVFADLFFDNPLLVMRLPAFITGLCLSILFFLVLKKYLGFQISLLSAIIFSLSEQTNFYSSQGRGYILVTFFAFVSFYSLAQFIFYGRKFYRLLFVISSILGFYTLPVFLYPFSSMVAWSLLIIGKDRDKSLLFKTMLIYSLIVVWVVILYLPVLLLNPVEVVFGNTWVSSPTDFYSKFPEYIFHLNSFWWGDNFSILFSIIALTGLVWFGAKYGFNVAAAITLFLFLPLLMIFLQKVLPFERVWLYYLLFLSVGISYFIIGLVNLLVRNISFQNTAGFASIVIVLVFYSFYNFRIVGRKTFSYYKELDQFLVKVDSLHVKNIQVTDPEYNTFIRLHSLEKNDTTNISGEKVEGNELLIIPQKQPLLDSAYIFLFQNSYVKAYKSRNQPL